MILRSKVGFTFLKTPFQGSVHPKNKGFLHIRFSFFPESTDNEQNTTAGTQEKRTGDSGYQIRDLQR